LSLLLVEEDRGKGVIKVLKKYYGRMESRPEERNKLQAKIKRKEDLVGKAQCTFSQELLVKCRQSNACKRSHGDDLWLGVLPSPIFVITRHP